MRQSRYTFYGRLPTPPAFAMNTDAKVRMAVRERNAFDALLQHKATDQYLQVLEALAECSVRAIRHARKLSYCRHLDPDQLAQCERVMYRLAHALRRAQARKETTGVYGLDAIDRQCVIDADQWYGAMTEQGAIPRAVWLMAYRDGVQCRGRVVVPAWEAVQ